MMRLWKDVKHIKPNADGVIRDGDWSAKIGTDTIIADKAAIGNGATIGDGAKIGTFASIGNCSSIRDGAKIGNSAIIGIYAIIGNSAKIGGGTSIGDLAIVADKAAIGCNVRLVAALPQVSLCQKWLLHPYAPGKVRLGCYVGDYDTLRARTTADWDKHCYTAAHVDVILRTLDYFESIEHLIFEEVK